MPTVSGALQELIVISSQIEVRISVIGGGWTDSCRETQPPGAMDRKGQENNMHIRAINHDRLCSTRFERDIETEI